MRFLAFILLSKINPIKFNMTYITFFEIRIRLFWNFGTFVSFWQHFWHFIFQIQKRHFIHMKYYGSLFVGFSIQVLRIISVFCLTPNLSKKNYFKRKCKHNDQLKVWMKKYMSSVTGYHMTHQENLWKKTQCIARITKTSFVAHCFPCQNIRVS